MGQNQQAIGYLKQSAFNTPNLPTTPNYGVRTFSNPPKVASSSPHYKTNQAFNQAAIFVSTREGQIDVAGDVSPSNISVLVESGLGPAASGVSKAGVGVKPYVTARLAEGLTQYWTAQDQQVNTLDFMYAVNQNFQFTAQMLGPAAVVTTSAWSTVAVVPTNVTPFGNWQVYITHGGSAYCIRKMSVKVDNHLVPHYCSAQTQPINATLAGLTPLYYDQGDGEVLVDLEAQYVGNVGSLYEMWQLQTVDMAWTILALDPRTGATAAVQIDIARLGYLTGELQREVTNWQHMTGVGLFDNTAGTPLTITVTQ